MGDDDHRERHADEWIEWTRTPGHDAFWSVPMFLWVTARRLSAR